MEQKFMILNYRDNILVTKLSSSDVCAILKYISALPASNFDVVQGQEFVTQDFVEMVDDSWRYNPQPQEGVK